MALYVSVSGFLFSVSDCRYRDEPSIACRYPPPKRGARRPPDTAIRLPAGHKPKTSRPSLCLCAFQFPRLFDLLCWWCDCRGLSAEGACVTCPTRLRGKPGGLSIAGNVVACSQGSESNPPAGPFRQERNSSALHRCAPAAGPLKRLRSEWHSAAHTPPPAARSQAAGAPRVKVVGARLAVPSAPRFAGCQPAQSEVEQRPPHRARRLTVAPRDPSRRRVLRGSAAI